MNSTEYWINRQKQNIKHAQKIENIFLAEQKKHYVGMLGYIDGKVSNLFAKYGENGVLSRSDLYDYNRYNNLRKDIYNKCSDFYKQQQSEMYLTLSSIYKDTFKNINFEGNNDIIKWNKINNSVMQSSVNSIRYGKDFSNRVWDNTDLLAKRVSNQIESIVSGSGTISDCKKAIQKEFNSSFANVDRLVRTESMYNLNNATLDRYASMGIIKYKIVVTEDSRTSEICNKMDGKVFKISEAEVGVNLPPLHVRCRSTIIPVIDDHLTKGKNEDKISVDDIQIGKSLGASAKNYPVKLPDGNYTKFVEGTSITNVRIFAGNGTKTEIKDRFFLESEYNIPSDEWKKISGNGIIYIEHKPTKAEIHWYEARDIRCKMKVKRFL